MKARKADLGKPAFLAEGGFGKVFRVDGFRLPGDPTPLAYKEFTRQHADQARSARAAVAFRQGLSPADRAELDRFGTWPRALVQDRTGAVCGLLMPLIPAEFFCRQADPDSGQLTSKPREMSWLIASAAQRSAAQVDLPEVDRTERLMLLAQLVYAIGRLHKHGWVFGDLSFKNAAFTLDPPQVMLLDCDGAAALADTARKQSSTPYWDPPECPIAPPLGQRPQQDLQDTLTDTYKLGLVILRCLTPGKGAATSRSVDRLTGELDAAGVSLVTRALSANRTARPTARELYDYLYRVTSPRIAVPEVVFARLATPFRVRGQDVRIEWQINNAASVMISVGSTLRLQASLQRHPGGYVFRADQSGPVSIEVRNRFGTVQADLGEVTLYELPPFTVDLNYLPRPQVPTVEAFSLDQVTAALTGRPGAQVGVPAIPALPSLNTHGLVDSLLPDRPVMAMRPRIDEAIEEAASAVTGMVLDAGRQFAAAQRQQNLGSWK